MRKILTMLAMLALSSSVLAANDNGKISSLFDSTPTNGNITILSKKELSDIKGGVRSPSYTCSVCGAKHGGVYSPHVCHNCYNKGYRVHSVRRR